MVARRASLALGAVLVLVAVLLAPSAASAHELRPTPLAQPIFPPGSSAFFSAMVFDPANGDVYVANWNDPVVTVLNGSSGSVIANVSVGQNPDALALDSATGDVYVANGGSGTVSVISGTTESVVESVGVGFEPCALAFDPVNSEVYVANYGSGNVTAIDPATGVESSIAVTDSIDSLGVNTTNGNVYVGNYFGEDVLHVIGAGTNTVIARVLTPGATPWSLAVDSRDGMVYVPLNGSGSDRVAVVNQSTDSIGAMVPVGGSPRALAVDPVNDDVYVLNLGTNNVSVLSEATDAVVATVPVGLVPWAVAIDEATNTIFVANWGSNNVTVIDGTVNQVVQTVPTGTQPSALAVDPTTGKVFVANYGSGNVSGFAPIGPVSTPTGCTGGSCSPSDAAGAGILVGVLLAATAVAVLLMRTRPRRR